MIQKHKGWLIGGAALGLTLPFAVKMYEAATLDGVRPVVIWLLWPMSLIFVISRSYPEISDKILFGVAMLGNAILYSPRFCVAHFWASLFWHQFSSGRFHHLQMPL